MNKRLQQFLSAENLTQTQFADSIGVAKASVSHILSGRNRPGYDFLTSLASNYPRLNMEWLFSGKGKMYKDPEIFPMTDSEQVNSISSIDINTLGNQSQSTDNKRKIEKILVFFTDGTFTEIS